ncbi:glycoside hydrolase family 95 protein [Mucilaginibacter sp. SJ]|uniref:glycoside hydrolase family 95 protein n=1 Tax=Mucilaginibacter sp. SJ TaxID=3029053 RepID=UPI0023A9EAD0|nr:glycoside hydrolase family 95 protein [Mucilaginibacter sp. SJ]WEA00644.1 glycoside hydrolase family 95 protein [Mucilaginibacter sp. SJ]
MIKRNTVFFRALLLVLFFLGSDKLFAQQSVKKLWYARPAKRWVEAIPVGNGKIGAMIFGDPKNELLQLNESTLYSGGPVKKVINPASATYLPDIRKALLRDSDYSTADKLARNMQGLYTESYLPIGDLSLKQEFSGAEISGYYRDLNLSTALATTRFSASGVSYTRQVFTSAPANILVMKLTANKAGAISFLASLKSQLHFSIQKAASDELIMKGKAPAHVDPVYYNPEGREHVVYDDTTGCNGMRFQVRLKIVAKGGRVVADTAGIRVTGADEALVYIAEATSFNGFDKCPDSQGKDENALANAYLSGALKKNYGSLLKEHLSDYRKYFDRLSFTLNDTLGLRNTQRSLPTDERLKQYSKGSYDPFLETLYFQFGRYLLISCSRPGGPPANLQGIWNKELRAPWSSNYTININTEMNYWPAEVTNLSEMHLPLLAFLKGLSVTGANTAKEFYNLGGWVAHHNSDIWATSNPVGDVGNGDPVWANWAMGGAWLSRHLWEHYTFTNDKKFLADSAYKIMKGAALFISDWLVDDGNGHLVTAPSVSPENKFKDTRGKPQGVSVATTMDMAIIWDLFTNVTAASKELGIDKSFRDSILAKRNRLFPMRTGSGGQLLEWYKEFQETDPQHRHISHLYGLYPGSQITAATPEFFAAAKKTLELRGDGGTGWSRGWKINWWARVGDGDHAYHLIRQLLQYTNTDEIEMHDSGGTYPNFFDAHPPFQIDGNFAGTAGMAEMLIQSHEGYINILPALPTAWKSGEIKGLRARGGFQVNIQWHNGQLSAASVKSSVSRQCLIKYGKELKIAGVKGKLSKISDGYLFSFFAKKGQIYTVIPASDKNNSKQLRL